MNKKTWKREVGFCMFLHLVVLTYWGTAGALSALGILAVPYIAFMMGAFGLDAVIKQGNFNFSAPKD